MCHYQTFCKFNNFFNLITGFKDSRTLKPLASVLMTLIFPSEAHIIHLHFPLCSLKPVTIVIYYFCSFLRQNQQLKSLFNIIKQYQPKQDLIIYIPTLRISVHIYACLLLNLQKKY